MQEHFDECRMSAHRSGDVIWIDMFHVPEHLRGKGVGRAYLAHWEATLPPDVTLVRLMAADTGSGNSRGFWDACGYHYRYDGESLDYEAEHEMHKGVNGHPTPKMFWIDGDE